MMEAINKKKITVLTPTFNRGNLLNKCYVSLMKQTNKNFKWLIVDDGSTDNTEDIVTEWMKEKKIKIQYLKKKNGGKHRAINYAVDYIDSDLVIILDSDDWLVNDAIEKIINLYHEYKDNDEICGFTFLKKYPNNELMGDIFPNEGRYNFIRWRVNGVVSGDQCDIVYTHFLKKYPFTEYANEKYIGESTLWIKLGLYYDMICKNEAIYVADYLDDGLTKNGRILRLNSPNGSMEYANLCTLKQCSIKRKITYSPLYTAYGLISNKKIIDILKRSNNKIMIFLTLPIGIFLKIYWSKKYKL